MQAGSARATLRLAADAHERYGVRLSLAIGRIRVRAYVTPCVAPGQVFIPMHYATTNQLTHAHFDPYSKQPSYKDCAVRIRAVESYHSSI